MFKVIIAGFQHLLHLDWVDNRVAILIHNTNVVESLDSLLNLAEHQDLLFQRIFLLSEFLGFLEEFSPICFEAVFKLFHFFHLCSTSLSLRRILHHVSRLAFGGYGGYNLNGTYC